MIRDKDLYNMTYVQLLTELENCMYTAIKIKQELNKKDQDKKKDAKKILEKIQNKTYEIKKLSTENKELYGSVKPTEISKLIHEKENVEINPSNIQPSKEIKSLGEFKVEINLHSDVQTQITVKVVPQEEIK